MRLFSKLPGTLWRPHKVFGGKENHHDSDCLSLKPAQTFNRE